MCQLFASSHSYVSVLWTWLAGSARCSCVQLSFSSRWHLCAEPTHSSWRVVYSLCVWCTCTQINILMGSWCGATWSCEPGPSKHRYWDVSWATTHQMAKQTNTAIQQGNQTTNQARPGTRAVNITECACRSLTLKRMKTQSASHSL